MNESLLGCLVWAVFLGLVTLANSAIQFFFPGSAAWAPLAAIFLVPTVWFVALFGSMIWSGRRRR